MLYNNWFKTAINNQIPIVYIIFVSAKSMIDVVKTNINTLIISKMELVDLSKKLKSMYENALKGEKAVSIHLFGIEYADEIRKSNYSISEIVELAGISKSYVVEVNKGINISKYVTLKRKWIILKKLSKHRLERWTSFWNL